MTQSSQSGAPAVDGQKKSKDAGWLFFLLFGGGFVLLCALALLGSK
jgi:hypothetical protein